MIRNIIKKRISTREFNSNIIHDFIIYDVINVSKFAPSGKNRQPWKIKIIDNNTKNEILKILNSKMKSLNDHGSLSLTINAIN